MKTGGGVEGRTSMGWLIETRDLKRVYGNGECVRALDGVNLRVAHGEFVAIMGPSGSGKSTLLNVLGALDLPSSGQVLIDGRDLAKIKNKDGFRARSVGFVFQLHNLLPTMTAMENIEIPMIGLLPPVQRRRRALELLELVDLKERARHMPGQLSGGQRQRVAVARALANHPPLVLADEPTGSLDSVNGQEIMRLLRELNRSQGTTFVVVTHDLSVARQTDRVIFMQDGKIVREDRIGTPIEEDLKAWRHSGLGRRLLEGDSELLESLMLRPEEAQIVKKLIAERE